MTARHKTWARIIGLLCGWAVSVAFVLSGALPRVEERFGAAVKLVLGRAGELVVTPPPPGMILAARELHPGAEGAGGRGELRLFNPTEVPLTVRPVLAPVTSDLERFVQVSVRAGNRTIFDGSLTDLRGGAAQSFRLGSKQRERISIAVRLPAGMRHHQYEAQTLDGKIELLTEIVGP